jgi:hypothetical protein
MLFQNIQDKDDFIQKIAQFLLPTKREETEFETSVLRLGGLGWSPPITFSHKMTVETGDPTYSDSQIEDALVDFYTRDENANLGELVKNLLDKTELAPWHPILSECFESFLAERYLITIPTLVSVMEGVLALRLGMSTSRNVKMMRPTRDMAQQPHAFGLDRSIWLSVSKIIDQLYQPVDFAGVTPDSLNRHLILHGRGTTKDAKMDSLRLFNLIGSLSIVDGSTTP